MAVGRGVVLRAAQERRDERGAVGAALRRGGGEAAGEFGDTVGVGGSAGGDAFEFDGGLVGLRSGFANPLVEGVAGTDAFRVLGVHGLDCGGLSLDLGSERVDLFSGGGLFEVKLGHAAGEDDTEAGAEFVAECAVTLGLGGLALEGGHLAGYFVEDVVDAGEIEAGGFETEFGEAFLGLETGDAGGFFEDSAAVERLGAEELADAFLADDGVGFAAEAGAHENVLDVAQATDLAVEKIFAVAGAEEAAGNGEFAGANRGAAELAAADLQDDIVGICEFGGVSLCRGWDDLRAFGFAFDDGAGLGLGDGLLGFGGVLLAEAGLVPVRGSGLVDDDFGFTVEAGSVVDLGIDEGEGDLGHSGWLAVAGAGEDDVFHLDATEGFGGLLAEDPGDGVGDVGLAAAVGADDGGDAFAGELDLSAITEGLEAEDLDLLELEQV